MNKTSQLKRKPEIFRNLTGISVNINKYNEIYQKLKPLYEEYNQKRLSHKTRKRKTGGGTQFKLYLEDRLLMLIIANGYTRK